MPALVLCLCASPSWAHAADARLSVAVASEDLNGAQTDAGKAMQLALPLLWDRIVPQSSRSEADLISPQFRLVSRIIPGKQLTIVEFNRKTVFQALRQRHIPAIVTAPRFHLLIRIRNSAGQPMQETQALLSDEAMRIAPQWGIELADNGPGLVMDWQWLDNQRLMLSVRGNTRLREFTQGRDLPDADPLPALEAWMKGLLLKARDAYAFQTDMSVSEGASGTVPGVEVRLTIDRPGGLMEQVAMEEALKNDPRIRNILPLALSRTRQTYLLQLEDVNDGWMREWFRRRGFNLSALPGGGWIALPFTHKSSFRALPDGRSRGPRGGSEQTK